MMASESVVSAGNGNTSAILRSEAVTFTVGRLSSTQTAASFGRLTRQGSELAPDYTADATPLPLKGGDALSHTTFFSPDVRDCQQPGAAALCRNEVESAAFGDALATAHTITLTFQAAFYRGRTQTHGCVVAITQGVLAQWFASDSPWFSATCRPDDISR